MYIREIFWKFINAYNKIDIKMKALDWSNIGFGYRKTDYNVRCRYSNGKWGEIEVSSEETLNIHMAAT